jgi:hypothetical protein
MAESSFKNPNYLLTYKRKGRGTIQERKKKDSKETLSNCQAKFVPNPLALPQALGETHAVAVEGQKEEEEPRIRIVERWPISEIIVS